MKEEELKGDRLKAAILAKKLYPLPSLIKSMSVLGSKAETFLSNTRSQPLEVPNVPMIKQRSFLSSSVIWGSSSMRADYLNSKKKKINPELF